MPSERVQRRIDELLDQAEAAMATRDWQVVAESAEMVLAVDPDNSDAESFLAMVARTGVTVADSVADEPILPSNVPIQ